MLIYVNSTLSLLLSLRVTSKQMLCQFSITCLSCTKFLFHVERGLYEYTKICLNMNFLYIHPKASKQPPIAVPIIMNNPVVIW